MKNRTGLFEEMLIGGTAGGFTCIFTNPLEVVKIRLQLQGELKSKGHYAIHYKNFVHAFYTIGKLDGIFALQSGLVTGILYQYALNGTRLGLYQILTNYGLHLDDSGSVSYPKALFLGAFCGAFGGFIGSPLYLIKTHSQASSQSEIAVGFQRKRTSLVSAFKSIYGSNGLKGLWRGWQAQVFRVMAGSSAQLSTFSKCKELLHQHQICNIQNLSNTILASFVSSVVVTLFMTPFDVFSTRIYNQPVDENGKGKYYSGIFDAFKKVVRTEGYFSLYKGATGVFMRLAPHTIITLATWDFFRQGYLKLFNLNDNNSSTR